ncbi:MAG: hypothetical protein KDE15_14615 [Erythrobacter sp.]|nr:hypothetical protein [Erythrobacter sp.]
MNKLSLLIALPLLVLTACGEEPAPEPTQTATVAPEPTPSAPTPDQALFTQLFADACPGAEPVNTSMCQRAMGADTVSCRYGLGDDEYLRHDATLALNEAGDGWTLVDPATVCAQ